MSNDQNDIIEENRREMEEERQPTPTPWGIKSPKGLTRKDQEGDRLIYSLNSNEHIAETFQYQGHSTKDQETSIANAEFIVRAVNSHEELLKVIKALRSDIAFVLTNSPQTHVKEVASLSVKYADKVLTKAEGKEDLTK